MSSIIAAWGLLKKLCVAAFAIPFGLLLLFIAARIVQVGEGSWLFWLFAAWPGYHGLNMIFGALSGFVGQGGPTMIDTRHGASRATREDLRRSRLL